MSWRVNNAHAVAMTTDWAERSGLPEYMSTRESLSSLLRVPAASLVLGGHSELVRLDKNSLVSETCLTLEKHQASDKLAVP